ncbi:MAG: hypothetical protein HLUCCX14_16465 [Marinobacter excellens HL-55]|uniref:Uncharacterized protein n=1 Tax=Marinobacter excellens HL-55 TaxID=1305731 RepID=A0A0P7ZD82_9GAMM|nr:MAG: hypothetical protein HLUCCX14_16465 [Marinobacter excellens HL-55]
MDQDDIQEADASLPEQSSGIRVDRELLTATKPYIEESAARSWWH